jgi:hypothetical protein
MTYSDGTIDRIEATFKELAEEVNRTSSSTRNGWVFFLALQAYFFVALAGITHRDLLLDTPISLPLLQVRIGLKEFFLFGPIILVLVHMGILLQHVMLARQARELHSRLSSFEGKSFFRTHRIRIHLHSYFFTQLIAGGQRSAFFAFFLSLMTWLSLGILPVVLLLDFQTTFLPYHDLQVTWAQRAYLIADIVILTIFAMFMRHPALGFVAGFGRTILERPISFLISFVLGIGAMFFSMSIATVPDEQLDRAMTAVWPAAIPDDREEAGPPRQAFRLTALLFDGGIDTLSGRPASMFGRNLVVTDTDLVKDGAFDEGETSINLRLRDLRYGTFDRSDMHQADLTGANLTRASLREVNLVEVRAAQAIFRGADLRGAQLFPFTSIGRPVSAIDLRGADLRGANLAGANLQGARLDGTLLEGTNLQGASLEPAMQEEAARQGAKF